MEIKYEVKDDRAYLRVKIKSLAEESKIIKREEYRFKKNDRVRNGLHNHRICNVRNESRAALIAYGYIRGKKFKEIEKNSGKIPYIISVRVHDLIKKYADKDTKASVSLKGYKFLEDWFRVE